MARVLVVEDDPQVRMMLRMMLERAGYEIGEACDGKEAIRSQRDAPADLIITDIIMPETEGLETIMEVRREWPSVPIIAISGGGTEPPEKYLKLAKGLGACRSFPKPVDRDEMLKAVGELIEA